MSQLQIFACISKVKVIWTLHLGNSGSVDHNSEYFNQNHQIFAKFCSHSFILIWTYTFYFYLCITNGHKFSSLGTALLSLSLRVSQSAIGILPGSIFGGAQALLSSSCVCWQNACLCIGWAVGYLSCWPFARGCSQKLSTFSGPSPWLPLGFSTM